jgi:hypothetical protein
MSGKRQHYIPRFLQEGFASRKNRDAVFTWVYRKGQRPVDTNIINVGVEGFFYTKTDDTEVDDLITKQEGPLSELVSALRESESVEVSDDRIPLLIGHLEFRTRHLRQSVLGPSSYLVSRLLDYVEGQDVYLKRLERRLRTDAAIKERLLTEMMKRRIPQRKFGECLKKYHALVPVAVQESKPMLCYLVAIMRPRLKEQISGMIKSAHIDALKMPAAASEGRIERYKKITYRVERVPDNSLILGDSVVLFMVEGPNPYRTILQKDEIMKAVLLPLSPGKLLVGSPSPAFIGLSELRQAIARRSVEFFISHQDSEPNRKLCKQIGEDASLISEEQLEQIIISVMNDESAS